MMSYARRIEYDFATIDLNGTAVGFSHGDDTFGWRFYPRFQTPDIESNATVFIRDLLIGGPSRNDLLRQRRLEPGMRECVAIVIMPSFVPYATLNVSSNWFKLTNPKCKRAGLRRRHEPEPARQVDPDLRLQRHGRRLLPRRRSRALLPKAKQLETRLPLQSTRVQVPYENTLGGFAMFNTGVTDLVARAHRLVRHPVHQPQGCDHPLPGRQPLQRPPDAGDRGRPACFQPGDAQPAGHAGRHPGRALLVGDASQKFVDVHLATPYGVTQHLLIPACAGRSHRSRPRAWPGSLDL